MAMGNDVYYEQIVKKRPTMKDTMIKIGILVSACILFFVAFSFVWSQFFGPIAFLLAIGIVVLAWYLISGLSLEYEYLYTNGEIDIDKISAKRKRKRMLTVKVSTFEEMGQYDAQKIKSQNFDLVFDACTHVMDEATYYIIFHGKEGKRCLLTLTPNENILAELQKQMKRRGIHR